MTLLTKGNSIRSSVSPIEIERLVKLGWRLTPTVADVEIPKPADEKEPPL